MKSDLHATSIFECTPFNTLQHAFLFDNRLTKRRMG